MNEVHYVSTNGERSGRSSHFFDRAVLADDVCIIQNNRSKALESSFKYAVVTADLKSLDGEKVRTS